MVENFNFFYFMYIAFALGLFFGLYFVLRSRSKRTAEIVLFSLLLASFVLHFLKLTFDFYQAWMPRSIRTITPENICAVSVLVFPWFFLSKSKLCKDYMFYIGILSGVGATVFPIDAIGHHPFDLEVMRFYLSHILLWVVPLLMVMLKLHTLDYKRIYKVPFLFYLVLCVILANEVILIGAGFVNMDFLFSNDVRNATLIFGPLAEIELIGRVFLFLTPEIFLTVPIGPNAGDPFYWPILWMVVPTFVYFMIVGPLMALPFEYKNMKADILRLKSSS